MNNSADRKIYEITQILCRCEQIKSDLSSLRSDDAKIYFEVYKRPEMLKRVDIYFLQMLIIQICMILNPKEDHCIKNIANHLLNDPSTEWKTSDSSSKLHECVKQLTEIEDKCLKNFKILRDKFWVHRDAKRDNYTISISKAEVFEILSQLQRNFNNICVNTCRAEIVFDRLSDREPIEISQLAKLAKIRKRMDSEIYHPGSELSRDITTILLNRKTMPS